MFRTLFQTYDRIVFFDTETTGFRSEKDDQIIELAAVSVSREGTKTSMDDFVRLFLKPAVPKQIVELTGITDLDLAGGISEREALAKFAGLMAGGRTLLAAHNAQFDLLFLAYAVLRHRAEHPEWLRLFNAADYLDTLTVYRDRHEYPHRLESAIETYRLAGKVRNSHRAVDDCEALFEVAKAMEEERDDLASYVNLFGYSPKYGISGRTLKKVTYLPQGFSGVPLPGRKNRK